MPSVKECPDMLLHLREASGQVDSLTAALALARAGEPCSAESAQLGTSRSDQVARPRPRPPLRTRTRTRTPPRIIPVGSLLAPLGRWREHVGGLPRSHGSLQAVDGEAVSPRSLTSVTTPSTFMPTRRFLYLSSSTYLPSPTFLAPATPRGSLSREEGWRVVDRSVGFGGEEKAMGRRRRGEPVGEDVGTARGFSMVQVKFQGSSCSWRCAWRVKGIRTPPSSSSNSFFERFFPEPPPPPPVLPPRGRSSPPEPLPPRGRPPRRRPRLWFAWHPSHVTSARVRCLNALQPGHDCGCSRRRQLEIVSHRLLSAPAPSSCPFWGYGSLLGQIGGPFPPEGDQW